MNKELLQHLTRRRFLGTGLRISSQHAYAQHVPPSRCLVGQVDDTSGMFKKLRGGKTICQDVFLGRDRDICGNVEWIFMYWGIHRIPSIVPKTIHWGELLVVRHHRYREEYEYREDFYTNYFAEWPSWSRIICEFYVKVAVDKMC